MADKVSACCGRPLVSTLCFSGAEFYCTVCGNTYGILDAPDHVEVTQDVAQRMETDRRYFNSVATYTIPYRSKRIGCEQCDRAGSGEYHHDHATLKQKQLSNRAYGILEKGMYNNSEWFSLVKSLVDDGKKHA